MPTISAIIPRFSQARHVEQSVINALTQRLHDIEFIVADNRSTDRPDKAPASFRSNIKFHFIQAEKSKVERVRNNDVISCARFSHVLDADDSMAPTTLAESHDALSSDVQEGFGLKGNRSGAGTCSLKKRLSSRRNSKRNIARR